MRRREGGTGAAGPSMGGALAGAAVAEVRRRSHSSIKRSRSSAGRLRMAEILSRYDP